MKTGYQCCALVAVILATGCATPQPTVIRGYDGPEQPAAALAVVTAPHEVDVLKVDGGPVARPDLLGQGGRKRVELLPGTRTLTVRYYQPADLDTYGTPGVLPDRSPPRAFRFEAAAGRTYAITYRFDGDRVDLRLDHEAGTIEASPAVDTDPLPAPGPTPAPAAVDPQPAGSGDSPSLQILKQTWRETSREDRNAFRKWIVDAPDP